MIINQIAWIFFFLIVAPLGAATMAKIIVEEEIFSHPRAWIRRIAGQCSLTWSIAKGALCTGLWP